MRRISRHLRSYLLMLLMAAFVVVPVADALVCAGDTHTDTVQLDATDDGGDSAADHAGACSHNHCHHAGQGLPADALAPLGRPLATRWANTSDAAADAADLDQLTRPPRM